MTSLEQLSALSSVPLAAMDKSAAGDIGAISIDPLSAKELRLLRFIEGSANPYFFRIGGNLVKTQFSASGLTLQEALVKAAPKNTAGKYARRDV
ncbi:MAG: hypothetical protein FWH06_02335 [Oscillospiraceae bacterium]|nr:hypothetical protein [Oscillospiraceae bacterium]